MPVKAEKRCNTALHHHVNTWRDAKAEEHALLLARMILLVIHFMLVFWNASWNSQPTLSHSDIRSREPPAPDASLFSPATNLCSPPAHMSIAGQCLPSPSTIRGLPDLHLSRRIVSAQLREIARRRRVVGLAARSPRPRLRFSHHAHRHLRLAILIMGALFLTAPSVPSGPRIYTPTRGTTTVHGATLLTIIDNLPLFQQRRLRTAAVSISLSLPRTPAVPPEPSFRVRSARSGSDEGSPCPAPPHELLAHAASGPRM
ncbi:hypothetical protein DFH09DRAFT_1318039 [Mycena vulgaris]|nr:hypothetical protein DFH09DRAFT_1318039 [Mycena vulgaris]